MSVPENAAAAALGFIEQTIYANEDLSAGVTWRNDEVLELLRVARDIMIGQRCGFCEASAGLPGDNEYCVHNGSAHPWVPATWVSSQAGLASFRGTHQG